MVDGPDGPIHYRCHLEDMAGASGIVHPLLGRRAIWSASILRLSALLIDPPFAEAAVPLASFCKTIDNLIGLTAAYEDWRIDDSIYPGIASERMMFIVYHPISQSPVQR